MINQVYIERREVEVTDMNVTLQQKDRLFFSQPINIHRLVKSLLALALSGPLLFHYAAPQCYNTSYICISTLHWGCCYVNV